MNNKGDKKKKYSLLTRVLLEEADKQKKRNIRFLKGLESFQARIQAET